jgi:phage baseplate assembly protein W
MLPDFGCGMHDMVFAPNDSLTTSIIVQTVREALVASEPRVDVLEVDAAARQDDPNRLLIKITYRIRSNNAIGNVVYPFYIKEGS